MNEMIRGKYCVANCDTIQIIYVIYASIDSALMHIGYKERLDE